jgi:hypothetical protein
MKYMRGSRATGSLQKGRKPWRSEAHKRTEAFGFQAVTADQAPEVVETARGEVFVMSKDIFGYGSRL